MGKKRTRSSARFGPRYGRRVRKVIDSIESGERKRHRCPRCLGFSLKRIGTGIWKCSRCDTVITGGAYLPKYAE
jgi:large subunit ribosomal protein L37Ae